MPALDIKRNTAPPVGAMETAQDLPCSTPEEYEQLCRTQNIMVLLNEEYAKDMDELNRAILILEGKKKQYEDSQCDLSDI